jgi:hypothetical protein
MKRNIAARHDGVGISQAARTHVAKLADAKSGFCNPKFKGVGTFNANFADDFPGHAI